MLCSMRSLSNTSMRFARCRRVCRRCMPLLWDSALHALTTIVYNACSAFRPCCTSRGDTCHNPLFQLSTFCLVFVLLRDINVNDPVQIRCKWLRFDPCFGRNVSHFFAFWRCSTPITKVQGKMPYICMVYVQARSPPRMSL
jgi:hypothetical protein